MPKRLAGPLASALLVVSVATVAEAQEPLGCPEIDEGAGVPVDLRGARPHSIELCGLPVELGEQRAEPSTEGTTGQGG